MKESSLNIVNPWSETKEQIYNSLDTTEYGLTQDKAQERYDLYGKNFFNNKEKKSALLIFIKQFTSPLIFILICATAITFFLKEWVEVFVISLAILINSGLGFYREYHAETTLDKLSSFIKDRSRVFRDGHEQEIDSELLVVGDLIKLSYGSRVPADARVISANNLKVDESILTGESLPIQKKIEIVSTSASVADRTNMVHAGTLIVEGFGSAIVVATGNITEIGKIAGLVSSTHRAKTPIQKGLSRLAWIIFGCVVLIVIGIFILGVIRGESVLEMLILSAAVSVGAVPEALPIALTVILSIGAERIAHKKGITRTLIAAETLGSTSLIMTDKTGTLTEANMQLVGVYTKEEIILGDTAIKKYDSEDEAMVTIAVQNIDVVVENPELNIKEWVFKGKPFEVNIAKVARDNGIDVERFRTNNTSSIIVPFNSTHKFSVSFFKGVYTIMGAPDILLSRSDVNAEMYSLIESWIAKASAEGKRLIAIGRSTKKISSINDVHDIEFIGILAFFDPVRKEVPEAIKKIESLGVRVIMVTGDLKGTAISVAKDIGWNVSENEVLTGQDLKTFDDEYLLKILPSIKIFARVTPEDKLRVGLLYRNLGEVVAMTGDGVNDAPSLKAMDIGVAIGSGSDVAKSAADLVLLDDNFKTISLAIEEGRRILVNIRKTFVYLMSNSLDEVFVVGGSLLVGIPLPLTALQIIWVNLFTGSLPALAFAYDEDFDREKEVKRSKLKTIFTKEVNILTFGIGVLSSLLLFLLYFILIKTGVEIAIARSVLFVCFASYILVVAFSFRSLNKHLFSYPIFSNKKLNQSILLAILILVLTMILPITRNLFGLAILPISWLWIVLLWLVVNILLVEFAKFLFRKKVFI